MWHSRRGNFIVGALVGLLSVFSWRFVRRTNTSTVFTCRMVGAKTLTSSALPVAGRDAGSGGSGRGDFFPIDLPSSAVLTHSSPHLTATFAWPTRTLSARAPQPALPSQWPSNPLPSQLTAPLPALPIRVPTFGLRPLPAPTPPTSPSHAPSPATSGHALAVGVLNLWGTPEQVLSELWVMNVLSLAFAGKHLHPLGPGDLAGADVILVGTYGGRNDAASVIAGHRHHAVTVWFASENLDSFGQINGDARDELVDVVDVSLGMARFILPPEVLANPHTPPGAVLASLAASSSNFVRTPWWLPYVLEPGRCALHPSLYAVGDAAAWTARPGFATILTKHAPYPRTELFGNFSALALELNAMNASGRSDRRVDAPGIAFHNMEWPGGPNTHLAGKVEFVSGYRFNLQPENSRTQSRGYVTEKMPQAHMAGAVPVWWGDPFEDEWFNPRRVLILDDDSVDGGIPMPELLDRVRALEIDASARDAFFAEPILQPDASLRMHEWCTKVGGLFAAAVERVQRERLVLAP